MLGARVMALVRVGWFDEASHWAVKGRCAAKRASTHFRNGGL